MDFNEVKTIVDAMAEEFDSHAFFLKFLEKCPSSYGHLLIKHGNVTTAHAEIGKFLLNNASGLGIAKKDKDNNSPNIFGNIAPCAQWEKTE